MLGGVILSGHKVRDPPFPGEVLMPHPSFANCVRPQSWLISELRSAFSDPKTNSWPSSFPFLKLLRPATSCGYGNFKLMDNEKMPWITGSQISCNFLILDKQKCLQNSGYKVRSLFRGIILKLPGLVQPFSLGLQELVLYDRDKSDVWLLVCKNRISFFFSYQVFREMVTC